MKLFKKAPAFVGRNLSLFVGNGDRRIGDNEILEGVYWEKFVKQGFLVPVDESEVKLESKKVIPKIKKVKLKEPEEVKTKEVVESGITKSTADKMAEIQGESGKSVSTKSKSKRRKK